MIRKKKSSGRAQGGEKVEELVPLGGGQGREQFALGAFKYLQPRFVAAAALVGQLGPDGSAIAGIIGAFYQAIGFEAVHELGDVRAYARPAFGQSTERQGLAG